MKKTAINIGIALIWSAALITVISAVIYFVWNTAILWMIPSAESISFLVSLGIGTLFTIINNVIDHWTKRIIELKRLKAFESLNVLATLNNDLAFIKSVLYEKEILTDIDFIAMEQPKDAR